MLPARISALLNNQLLTERFVNLSLCSVSFGPKTGFYPALYTLHGLYKLYTERPNMHLISF